MKTLLRLSKPFFVLCSFLGAASAFAGPTWIQGTEYYGSMPRTEACPSMLSLSEIADVVVFSYGKEHIYKPTAYRSAPIAGSGNYCMYTYTRPDGTTINREAKLKSTNELIFVVTLPNCVSGDKKSLSWPMGRDIPPDGYQDFGTVYPATACFSGCNAIYDGTGSEPYTIPDSETADIVYIDANYTFDGSTCTTSSAEPVSPGIPPAPEPGGGDTGGGDTGGGDTGGGDTGGGDTGGGDTGGGDTGGGDTGGGDTGGGDTGGGDTGGGDTGGGDTGGGDTGGGDTGGGDTGGGDTGGGDTGGGDTGGGDTGGGDFTGPVLADDVPTFDQSLSTFMHRLNSSPIVSAIGNVDLPSGGSCSVGSASVFFGTLSFDYFCQLMPQVLGALSYVFLAIWAWVAVRVFLSA